MGKPSAENLDRADIAYEETKENGDHPPTLFDPKTIHLLLVISFISLAVTSTVGICNVVLGWAGGSTSMVAYGLETLLDICTTLILIWRFHLADVSVEYAKESQEKEAVGEVLIAFSFLASFLAVLAVSITEFQMGKSTHAFGQLVVIAGVSAGLTMLLVVAKYSLYRQIGETTIFQDMTSSMAVAITGLVVCIELAVVKDSPEMWWLDTVGGLIISSLTAMYGIYTLCNFPWYKKEFYRPLLPSCYTDKEEDEICLAS
eukprot:Clim_evm60s218 gene=Clim_evmTU60s218